MVREYKKTDLEVVMEIWKDAQSIAHPFLSNAFVEKVRIMMNDIFIPNSKTWVYETDDLVAGFISMMDNEIGGLFVNPKMQSKGVGTSLINFIRNHYSIIEVEVFANNKIGLPFYEKHGFIRLHNYLHAESQQEILRMRKN